MVPKQHVVVERGVRTLFLSSTRAFRLLIYSWKLINTIFFFTEREHVEAFLYIIRLNSVNIYFKGVVLSFKEMCNCGATIWCLRWDLLTIAAWVPNGSCLKQYRCSVILSFTVSSQWQKWNNQKLSFCCMATAKLRSTQPWPVELQILLCYSTSLSCTVVWILRPFLSRFTQAAKFTKLTF